MKKKKLTGLVLPKSGTELSNEACREIQNRHYNVIKTMADEGKSVQEIADACRKITNEVADRQAE